MLLFEDALGKTQESKRHLILGNGFSIAAYESFSYGSLMEQADFSDHTELKEIFEALQTSDFEEVIASLNKASLLLPIFGGNEDIAKAMASEAETLKEILVKAIGGNHPSRPNEISENKYESCRAFLSNFIGRPRNNLQGKIYTLNYDLLLYWALLHDDDSSMWSEDGLGNTDSLKRDDGFRAPYDDPEAEFVTWDANGSNSQNLYFVHGGLHLFDEGADLKKLCWERSGGNPLIEQIREALNSGKFPLFVSEGSTDEKLKKIRHSGYLNRSLRSLNSAANAAKNAFFIYGHSLAPNDAHILDCLARGSFSELYVSMFGDPSSEANQTLQKRAESIAARRRKDRPLSIQYFDATSAHIWTD